MSTRDAKANAAAAQAYATSQRSWPARHKFLTAFGALVVLIIAIAIGSQSGSSSSGTSSAGGGSAAAPATAAGLNTPVRDGKFEFTVTAVDPGKATVGADGLSQTAQGQFIVMHVTVRNIGDQSQIFDASAQKLTDQQGRQATAGVDGIYIDPQNFLAQINPGNSVQGVVVFDIPKDGIPQTFELHDSIFSGGVSVAAT